MFRMKTDTDDAKEKKKINTAEIPVFTYVQPPVEAAFGAIATDFGILALFNLVFFAGAFVAFLRFDAR
jgi:hypothetical protein